MAAHPRRRSREPHEVMGGQVSANHESQTSAADSRTLTRVVSEVAIRDQPQLEDDDQGPFLSEADCERVANAIRRRIWSGYLGHKALRDSAERVSLHIAPILAALRDVPSTITSEQYDDALEALSGLRFALEYHQRPEQP